MENMDENSLIKMMELVKNKASVVDLSYTMEENMPAWPTHARYGTIVYESYDFGAVAMHSMVSFSEHSGTHIDAPRHFIRGGCPVDQLPATAVMGRGVTMDATCIKPCEVLTLQHIKSFEATHGEIKQGDVVMLRFGWDSKYRLQPDGEEFLNNWPGLSAEGAAYFLHKKVAAVGCDALSLDAFGAEPCVCHTTLLGNNIPIIENICNLSKLPVFSYVIGLPLKFKNGSGSPIRLIAFIE